MAMNACMNLAEAAAALSTTEVRILMLLKKQKLDGDLVAGEWRISASSVQVFQTTGTTPEHSNTCRSACQGCGGH